MAEAKVLKLRQIEQNPKALRTEVDKTNPAYLELKASIKDKGLTNAISARPVWADEVGPDGNKVQLTNDHGEPKYRLVDGLHRHTAMADLDIEECSVNIVNTADEDLIATQIAANAVNIPTTKAQYAQALKQMLQFSPMTIEALAVKVNKSADWIRKMISITNLPQSIQDLVDQGRMPVYNAIALARLPADRVQEYVPDACTKGPGEFPAEIDTVVKAINKAIREGKPEVPVFVARPKPRTVTVLQTVDASTLASVVSGISDPLEAAAAAVRWAIQLDPESVAAQKAKWDADMLAKEKKKAEAAAEKQKKQLEASGNMQPSA